MFRLSPSIFIWKYYPAPMLQRLWLVFHFLNKLSAACALGKPLHNGKRSIFLLFSLGWKHTLVLLVVIFTTTKNSTMGMTKEAVLAADFDSVIRASLQLLILDSHAAIYMWISLNVKSATVRYSFTSRLLKKPSTMFFICQKHFCSMCSLMDISSHKLWGKNVMYF